jgi:hypothetical protein
MQNKAFSKILIPIIVILFLAGGFFAYKYWWIPKEEAKLTTGTIANETANWKTYTNEKYGFEIKYPAEGKVVDGSESEGCRIFPLYPVSDERSNPIDISVDENPNDLTLNQWIEKEEKGLTIEEKETIFIGGVEGVKYFAHNGGVYPHTVLIKKGKFIYRIDGFREFNDQIFNQILSTFKFID